MAASTIVGKSQSNVFLINFSSTLIGIADGKQIANSVVVAKVERMARALGMTKTAVAERALDHLAMANPGAAKTLSDQHRMTALLAQLDRIPDREDAFDALPWDAQCLPT